jgi:hypothetical protein
VKIPMANELKKTKLEYIEILEEYLGNPESEDLINQVFSGYSTSEITNRDSISFTSSFKIRSVVDRIITSTEKKLTAKKHLHLLLNLAKLSLSRGELFLSSDIQ